MKRNRLSPKQRNQWTANQRANWNKICYPEKFSEFEVQAELWRRLSTELHSCEVRGCVPARCYIGQHAPRVYLDLVVFCDKQPVVVIECKNGHGTSLALTPGSRQDRRYSLFGVPVIQCPNMDAVNAVVDRVCDILSPVTPLWTPP